MGFHQCGWKQSLSPSPSITHLKCNKPDLQGKQKLPNGKEVGLNVQVNAIMAIFL